jgi:predicted PurR-regulated permease PerM
MAVIILFILIPGAIIVVGILGLLIGIPTIILLLVGLNEVKKVAENKLKQQ